MTEILTSALTETAETSTTELQIPNVKESVENASSLLTSITDKFISALPVLAFAVTVFFLGIILSKILLKITAKFVERSNIENTAGSFLISLVRVILYILVAIIAVAVVSVIAVTAGITIINLDRENRKKQPLQEKS